MRVRPLRLLSLLIAVLVGAVCAAPAAAAAVSGPDVSGWQHPQGFTINWKAAHTSGGAQFAFVKATEGTGYRNQYFASDFTALAGLKMARGAYHFAQPGTGTAVAQARYFVSVAGKLGARGDLPPVLDLEATGGLNPTKLIAWTKSYLAEVKRLTGRTPMIYTYPAFWQSSMANTTAFTGYPLWIATWGPKPILVGGWKRYTFWQYTDKAKLPGLPGTVDMNVFNGTVSQLRALANDAPPPPAPPSVKPSVPRGLTAVAGHDSATLQWRVPYATGGALLAYDVTVDGGKPTRLPATTQSYTATGLAVGPHNFTVAAVNTVGVGTAATASATLLVPTQVVVAPVAGGVTATVTRTDTGTALARTPVRVQVTPAAGTAPAPYDTITDAAGRIVVRASGPAEVTVTVLRSATVAPAVGRAMVAAAPKLALRLSSTRVKAGQTVTFTGTTDRSLAGATVYRQSYYGRAWHTRATGKVGTNGVVTFAVKPLTKSTGTYRLLLAASPKNAALVSPNVVLRAV
jgi:GH25 family lysozyme M1 (1,4-beta-N-acetylmuramidase)/plastocyanin